MRLQCITYCLHILINSNSFEEISLHILDIGVLFTFMQFLSSMTYLSSLIILKGSDSVEKKIFRSNANHLDKSNIYTYSGSMNRDIDYCNYNYNYNYNYNCYYNCKYNYSFLYFFLQGKQSYAEYARGLYAGP